MCGCKISQSFLNIVSPKTRIMIHSVIKIKKRILAIDAAPASTLVKPNIPAMMATIRNMNDHFNMIEVFME
jgi:hypothetical protein